MQYVVLCLGSIIAGDCALLSNLMGCNAAYSRLTVKILDRGHAVCDLAATEHLLFCEPHLNDSMYGNSRRTKCPISFFDSLLCLRHDYVSMTLTRSSIRLSHQTKAEVSRSQIPDHGIINRSSYDVQDGEN
eukprot:scaffold94396_cov36-Attheya_sp.AAC.1